MKAMSEYHCNGNTPLQRITRGTKIVYAKKAREVTQGDKGLVFLLSPVTCTVPELPKARYRIFMFGSDSYYIEKSRDGGILLWDMPRVLREGAQYFHLLRLPLKGIVVVPEYVQGRRANVRA